MFSVIDLAPGWVNLKTGFGDSKSSNLYYHMESKSMSLTPVFPEKLLPNVVDAIEVETNGKTFDFSFLYQVKGLSDLGLDIMRPKFTWKEAFDEDLFKKRLSAAVLGRKHNKIQTAESQETLIREIKKEEVKKSDAMEKEIFKLMKLGTRDEKRVKMNALGKNCLLMISERISITKEELKTKKQESRLRKNESLSRRKKAKQEKTKKNPAQPGPAQGIISTNEKLIEELKRKIDKNDIESFSNFVLTGKNKKNPTSLFHEFFNKLFKCTPKAEAIQPYNETSSLLVIKIMDQELIRSFAENQRKAKEIACIEILKKLNPYSTKLFAFCNEEGPVEAASSKIAMELEKKSIKENGAGEKFRKLVNLSNSVSKPIGKTIDTREAPALTREAPALTNKTTKRKSSSQNQIPERKTHECSSDIIDLISQNSEENEFQNEPATINSDSSKTIADPVSLRTNSRPYPQVMYDKEPVVDASVPGSFCEEKKKSSAKRAPEPLFEPLKEMETPNDATEMKSIGTIIQAQVNTTPLSREVSEPRIEKLKKIKEKPCGSDDDVMEIPSIPDVGNQKKKSKNYEEVESKEQTKKRFSHSERIQVKNNKENLKKYRGNREDTAENNKKKYKKHVNPSYPREERNSKKFKKRSESSSSESKEEKIKRKFKRKSKIISRSSSSSEYSISESENSSLESGEITSQYTEKFVLRNHYDKKDYSKFGLHSRNKNSESRKDKNKYGNKRLRTNQYRNNDEELKTSKKSCSFQESETIILD